MTPEQYLGKVLDMTEQAMQRADSAQERMIEKSAPEPKRVQCAHCNGYYNENEICRKNLCYKCEENLDDYRRILNQRNLFLLFIKDIQEAGNHATIMGMCGRILDQYKEEQL